MKTVEQLEAENKQLRSRLRKLQKRFQELRDSGNRLLLYHVGPHHAAALGLTKVPPLIINVGNKRIPR